MKVKVYVNWYSREVINEKEFKKKVEESTEDYKGDEYFFAEWLDAHYSAVEIWNLNEEQRKEVRSNFLIECEKLGLKDICNEWEEDEIEV